MGSMTRVLSRPVNKPCRTKNLDTDDREPPYLNANGNVDFSPNDMENPQNWSTPRRWGVTICAVLLVMNATFASSSPSGCLGGIMKEFDVSTEAAGLTVTLFVLGFSGGPLFAPLSELYGRRWVFYITFTIYVALTFLCAFAPNFGALLAGRFLTGTLVSAALSNAPGVLADLWNPIERGNAMACFAATVWIGPALGPVTSGFLELTKGWRWSFYLLICMGVTTWLLMLTIPETHAPTILRHKAERIRKLKIPGYENVKAPVEEEDRSMKVIYKIALTRPWIVLFDTISLLCAIYMSVVYMLLYMLFSVYPIVFQEKRGWNVGVGQLPLIGTIVGAVAGGLVMLWDTRRRTRRVQQGKAKMEDMEPEDRLPLSMVGGIGLAIAMFWMAWTAEYNSVHWIVPTISGCFLSLSMLLIFVNFTNYLVDTYLMYAASAIAANTVTRSLCGAAAPLFTRQMFSALGIGGGGSLIGGVATVLAVIPFMFYKYGKQIRVRSKFAPTSEKKAQRVADEEAANPTSHELESPLQNDSDSTVAPTELSHNQQSPPQHEDTSVLPPMDVLRPASEHTKEQV
ncbi:transporter [Tolypocladium capitatum]|uniref:Transporter n=1 Tax=Tolypocladium capitatum TaxID=45235 RepID=A0A2K3QGY4_9HYPO|nr:transporter [Tolypocladium capitatum]